MMVSPPYINHHIKTTIYLVGMSEDNTTATLDNYGSSIRDDLKIDKDGLGYIGLDMKYEVQALIDGTTELSGVSQSLGNGYYKYDINQLKNKMGYAIGDIRQQLGIAGNHLDEASTIDNQFVTKQNE
jgi:hypothetical protein